MRRKYKFRLWDISRNCFCNTKFITIDGVKTDFGNYHIDLEGQIRYMNYDSADLDENAVIQQFTGLKYDDGTEIYEGDIFNTKAGRYEVIFENGSFYAKYLMGIKIDRNYLLSELIDGSIPLGNIFENPDLLIL